MEQQGPCYEPHSLQHVHPPLQPNVGCHSPQVVICHKLGIKMNIVCLAMPLTLFAMLFSFPKETATPTCPRVPAALQGWSVPPSGIMYILHDANVEDEDFSSVDDGNNEGGIDNPGSDDGNDVIINADGEVLGLLHLALLVCNTLSLPKKEDMNRLRWQPQQYLTQSPSASAASQQKF